MGLIRANITTIKNAPNKPPEKSAQFPFAATWPGRGRSVSDTTGSTRRTLSVLILEIHVSRKDLPRAIDAVYPFVDLVLDMLHNVDNLQLPDSDSNPTVDTLLLSKESGGINWTFQSLDWAGVDTIGWRFEIPLKQVKVI